MRRALIALSVAAQLTAAQAAGNITPSAGMPPDVAAKFAKNMARNRLAELSAATGGVLADGTVLNNGAAGLPGSSRNCVTNIGAAPPPAIGSGLTFGATGATQDNTIIISGDVFNVCR